MKAKTDLGYAICAPACAILVRAADHGLFVPDALPRWIDYELLTCFALCHRAVAQQLS